MDAETAELPSTTRDDAPERPQLAGMALHNGVLVIGPTTWSAAVRRDDGSIGVTTELRPRAAGDRLARVPLLRGPARLLDMLRVLPRVRRTVPEARLGMESKEMLAGAGASMLANAAIRRRLGTGSTIQVAGELASMGVSVLAMRGGQLARYHGAEHKAIGGYEQGLPAAEVSRVHPRCGTQLALPMLLLGSAGTWVVRRALPNSPRVASALGQLFGVAAATELFRATQRGTGGRVAELAARAGHGLQRHATTAEPSVAQLEVAEAALRAVIDAESARS